MKIGTLLEIVFVVILLTVYFYVIDPFAGSNRWVAYAGYMALFIGLIFVMRKLEKRFEFLSKKLDMQLSVLFVAALLLMPFFLSMII